MELPSDFKWQYASGYEQIPVMISHNCVGVARINQREGDLKWQVTLDYHKDYRQYIFRPCETQWTGRAGMEQWVIRHQDRLRQEVAAILAAKEAGKIKPAE
ncbi:hypothetical protein [Stenotrophomonas sp. ATs4]|uniref:hypothetical protein n=1 Tax=Stenotrophomonas sp. ATs4 TaxID=3402766 RepID=UPI003F6E4FF6